MPYDIKQFSNRFSEEYLFLYNNRDEVDDYQKLMKEGDAFIKAHPRFVGEFVNCRNDYISSDREVVAFMRAVNAMNLEKELDALETDAAYDIQQISNRFSEEYDILYNSKNAIDNYYELLKEGDAFIEAHPRFIGEFNEFRKDFISSDREVVALMRTIKAMGLEKKLDAMENEKKPKAKSTHKRSDYER